MNVCHITFFLLFFFSGSIMYYNYYSGCPVCILWNILCHLRNYREFERLKFVGLPFLEHWGGQHLCSFAFLKSYKILSVLVRKKFFLSQFCSCHSTSLCLFPKCDLRNLRGFALPNCVLYLIIFVLYSLRFSIFTLIFCPILQCLTFHIPSRTNDNISEIKYIQIKEMSDHFLFFCFGTFCLFEWWASCGLEQRKRKLYLLILAEFEQPN